jgi:hypothetical protein
MSAPNRLRQLGDGFIQALREQRIAPGDRIVAEAAIG